MAFTATNPVREQLRAEILASLANASAPMTTGAIYKACPSAENSEDVSRLAWDLKRKGLIADGGKVPHPRGMPVNSYVIADASAASRIEAAKPIKVERKIPKTIKPPKPAASNPFAKFSISKPQEEPARITRDLPIHLQSAAPVAALEAPMSEDPTEYVPDPDSFALEPSELESLEGVDSDLAQALFAMSQMDDVGEITEAMAKKNCHCTKIAAPPKLPSRFSYTGFTAEVRSEHDENYLSFESTGNSDNTIILNMSGEVTFDLDEINLIPEVASFLHSLHVAD